MSSNHSFHEAFCRLVGPIVNDQERQFPELAEGDWLTECFRDIRAFEQRFPTQEEQEAVVAGFQEMEDILAAPLSESALLALTMDDPPQPTVTNTPAIAIDRIPGLGLPK